MAKATGKATNAQEGAETDQNALLGNSGETERTAALKAHEQAEADMETDPDFAPGTPENDLDEGETARLDNG